MRPEVAGCGLTLAGGAILTRRVVDAVCVSVPLVPVIVSESAHGTVLVVVFIVSVEEPEPLMDAGLKPALLTPVGNPDSLPTLRLTGPVKPLTGVTVTVKLVAPPGTTCCPPARRDGEVGVVGVTVILTAWAGSGPSCHSRRSVSATRCTRRR